MKNIIKKIDKKKMKLVFIGTLIFMVIAHGYCYTNLNFSHDSMRTFFWTKSDTLEIGRYLIPVFLIIRGKYYPPLLIGVLSFIFLALINYLLIEMFAIKEKRHILLTTAIMSTASTLTLLNATYIDFSDIYLFCILLMTIAAYIWRNYKKYAFIAILPLFIGMGIYQSYICFFIGIVMLLSIKDIFDKKDFKDIFSQGIKAIFLLLISLVLYAISLKVVTLVTGITLADKYNSVKDVLKYDGFKSIFSLLIETYKATYFYITNPSTYHVFIVKYLNIILIFLGIFSSIFIIKKEKIFKENIMLFIVLLVLLPFGINIVYFISKGYEHQLMIYSLFLLYLFFFVLLEKMQSKTSKFLNYLTVSIFVVIIASGVIYANQCYLKKNLEFDNTLVTMNRIVYKLESFPDYKVGESKIAFVGFLINNNSIAKKKDFDYNSVGLYDGFSLTYYRTYQQYFNNYLGYPMNIVSEEEAKELALKEEVKDMKAFPYDGYIKQVDDTIVIKLSD